MASKLLTQSEAEVKRMIQRHSTTPAKRLQADLSKFDRRGVAMLPIGFKSALFFLPHYGCPACDETGRGCLVYRPWRKRGGTRH